MSDYSPHRGDHLYVWRKVRIYQHHGIVLTEEDISNGISPDLVPSKIEPLMIIEQNLHGLDLVTLKQFRTEHPFHYEHDIGCVQYKTDPMDYYLSRSGTCYLTSRLSVDEVVRNAIRIYNDKRQREIWKSYSLVVRNCEQFAFICSTSVTHVLGEQVLRYVNAVKCLFIQGMSNAVKLVFQIVRQFAKEVLSGMSIEMIIKGNGLAALTAFTLEALILTVRLFIFYYHKEDRSKNLARSFAITPEDYLQQMIQAGFGSLSAFGMSIAGILLGSTLFLSSMAPMVCSIFFGFLGYIAAKWITGLIAIKIRKRFSTDEEEKQILFKNFPGDDDDTAQVIE